MIKERGGERGFFDDDLNAYYGSFREINRMANFENEYLGASCDNAFINDGLENVNQTTDWKNNNYLLYKKNKHQYGQEYKTIYQKLAERAELLEKKHHVMTDLFKRNEEKYGLQHYNCLKFWNEQCYDASKFNQNMLINTIWLQVLANHSR